MNPEIRRIAILVIRVMDVFLGLLAIPSAIILKTIRRLGVQFLPFTRRILCLIGVFPIRNHYYEPLFDCSTLTKPLCKTRKLPGINWNSGEQLDLLSRFQFGGELDSVPVRKPDELAYYFNNPNFGPGDAEYWYNLIRYIKPKRIIEIGCGYSTLMAEKAIARNRESGSACQHICIEPYEMPWLEQTGVEVIRRRVEEVDRSLFGSLSENDILFVDTSHIIRPQGDVVFEFLDLLPELKSGVIVHIHDIFSPGDYPAEWVCKYVRLFNEQYLLEAFLTFNDKYKIIGALNFLHLFHYDELKSKCPFLSPESGPCSFYMQKIG